ncbi:MAG: type II secretion system F family protein [Myxococcales bacterium]|jgi:tight adherence protein C
MQQLLSSDLVYYGLLLLVAAAAIALVTGVRYLLAARVDVVQERMRRTVNEPAVSDLPEPTAARPASGGGRTSLLELTLRPFARVARPGDEEELGLLRAKLSHAGYRDERALRVFLAAKVLLSLGLASLFLVFNARYPHEARVAAFYTVALMVAGFYMPNFWLSQRVTERQKAVGHALPDALDLLVTCVEAGLGLELAIQRVSDEIELSAPLLSAELTQTALEMRAGVARGQAFRRLADRTGVDDIKNLASIVIQTEVFGTSVSRSLRVMSESMRVRRMQRAEERAAMVAVKMTVPLIVFVMPSLFVVLLGPAVIRMIRVLFPQMGGEG